MSREEETIKALEYMSEKQALYEIAVSLGRIADMLAEMNGYVLQDGKQNE